MTTWSRPRSSTRVTSRRARHPTSETKESPCTTIQQPKRQRRTFTKRTISSSATTSSPSSPATPRPRQSWVSSCPDDAVEAQALLLRELAEARGEASEYLETLQRVAADFENYRKRVERDQIENVLRASQRLIEKLLPTLDAFDAALAYEPQTPAEDKLLDGMRGTHAQLMDTLGKEGLAAIAAVGEPFDPAVHEAVAGGGDGDLAVAQELRRGYTMQGRVVRPTLVIVEEAS